MATQKKPAHVVLFELGRKPDQNRSPAPKIYTAENSCLPRVVLYILSKLIPDVESISGKPSGYEMMRLQGRVEAYCDVLKELRRDFKEPQKRELSAILESLFVQTTNRKVRDSLNETRFPFY